MSPSFFGRVRISVFLLAFVSVGLAGDVDISGAPKPSTPQTLDDKIQSLKLQTIDLNRDLGIIEEELLFPAATQVAVFVFLDAGTPFKLESAQLKLDGRAVASHRYSEGEAQAVARGGAHRLYLGNVANGKHELIVVFAGKDAGGGDYRRGATLRIQKIEGPKYIELHIRSDVTIQQPVVVMKER